MRTIKLTEENSELFEKFDDGDFNNLLSTLAKLGFNEKLDQTGQFVLSEINKLNSRMELFLIPAKKGQIGEATVDAILCSAFPSAKITNVGKFSHSGDICFELNGYKILIEVKLYSRSVPTKEIDKFKRDLEGKDYDAGMFISWKQGIVKTPEITYNNHKDKYYILVPCADSRESIVWPIKCLLKMLKFNGEESKVTEQVISQVKSTIETCKLLSRNANKNAKVLTQEISKHKKETNRIIDTMKEELEKILNY